MILSDLMTPAEVIVGTSSKRLCNRFKDLGKDVTYYSLDSSIYGMEHLSGSQTEGLLHVEHAEGFEITPLVGLDNYKMFVIEEEGSARVIYRRDIPDRGPVVEARIPLGVVVSVFDEALRLLRVWRSRGKKHC